MEVFFYAVKPLCYRSLSQIWMAIPSRIKASPPADQIVIASPRMKWVMNSEMTGVR